ncbi:MAG: glycerate kinase [Acidobacteriota bacterium]
MKHTRSGLKQDALDIFLAGVKAVQPDRTIRQHVRLEDSRIFVDDLEFPLRDGTNIHVVGTGKASAAMALSLEEILGDRIKSGLISTKYGHGLPLKKIRVLEAGHPLPDISGLRAGKDIMRLLEGTGEKDLVFFLVSGGGSALLPVPADGISLDDKIKTTDVLLRAGASIHEINTLRKHISAIKGGQLARLVFPSTLVSLIISDVVGNDLDVIASGASVPDRSTFSDCLTVLNKYGLQPHVPESVLYRIRLGTAGFLMENPGPGDSVFERTRTRIIASNVQAAAAAEAKARELGYNAFILSTAIEGETREAALVHTALAEKIHNTGHPSVPPACLISGGETTVTIRGNGKGGRNQEFALAAAIALDECERTAVMSCGTDGTDGPTDAAGAFADGNTVRRAAELGMNARKYLDNNDSYHFFLPLGDLVFTGPTHTNVMDLRVVLMF